MNTKKSIEEILNKLSPEEQTIFVKCQLQAMSMRSSREFELMMSTVPKKVQEALGEFALLQLSEMDMREKTAKQKESGKEVRATALEILKELIASDQLEHCTHDELVDISVRMAQKLHDAT